MQFNDAGELLRPHPDSYRKWVFVGSNVTPVEENLDADGNLPADVTFPGFHNTYIHPDDFDHFKKTGKYRDGTQFIQENVEALSEGFSGEGHFQGEIWGNKASVKSKERFPDLPGNVGFFIWLDNYKDKTPLDSAPVGTVEKCNQCHSDFAEETDFVFEVHYPVLRDVKPKATE